MIQYGYNQQQKTLFITLKHLFWIAVPKCRKNISEVNSLTICCFHDPTASPGWHALLSKKQLLQVDLVWCVDCTWMMIIWLNIWKQSMVTSSFYRRTPDFCGHLIAMLHATHLSQTIITRLATVAAVQRIMRDFMQLGNWVWRPGKGADADQGWSVWWLQWSGGIFFWSNPSIGHPHWVDESELPDWWQEPRVLLGASSIRGIACQIMLDVD